MTLKSFFINIVSKLVIISFILFTAIILVCYMSGPPEIPDTFDTIFYTEDGKQIKGNSQNRKYIKLSDINKQIISATIAVEDKSFYKHYGFDFKRIIRAALKNVRHLSLKEGASTITQQYARNLYLTHDKTWKRKLKEAFYTIRLEMFYSKDDILEGYLNTIYYGHGAYGIERASHYYFDKGVNDLTIAEVSLLVGIPKGPTYYSPFNNEEKAFERQHYILSLLKKENIINKAQYNEAKQTTLNLIQPNLESITFAPHFSDYVLSEAETVLNVDRNDILNSGYQIYTTINEDLQLQLEETVKTNIKHNSELEIGALAIHPETGAIKAMIGGRSYEKSSFNRAVHAKRLVGSTFKPIIYYTALEHGFTPSTMLKSEPTTFKFDQDKAYKPTNFNNYYANKPITLTQAIALSDNIYAVKTNMFLGVKEVIHTARLFGIHSELPEVPSLALGSASISVNEMTQAYGMISNGGKQIKNHSIVKIVDRHGKTVYKRNIKRKQRLNEKKAFILSHLLTGMFDTSLNGHIEVTGASITPLLTKRFAGKSGTTETDSWMIGYSPSLVTGIWTGYDNNRKMVDLNEKRYAKEIWAHFMEHAHQDEEEESITVPQGVVAIPFDHETGKIATKHCPASRITYFEKGTEPTQYCDVHRPEQKKQQKNEDDKDKFFKRIFDFFF